MMDPGGLMLKPGGFARPKTKRCDDPNCDLEHDLDALMDPCCAKDLKDRRKAGRLMAQLREADPTRKALDRRRGAFDAAPLPLFEAAPPPPPPRREAARGRAGFSRAAATPRP